VFGILHALKLVAKANNILMHAGNLAYFSAKRF
jgi:hypothetical protein